MCINRWGAYQSYKNATPNDAPDAEAWLTPEFYRGMRLKQFRHYRLAHVTFMAHLEELIRQGYWVWLDPKWGRVYTTPKGVVPRLRKAWCTL